MDWSTLIAAVLGSSLLSTVIARQMDRRTGQSRAREDRYLKNADSARDALAELRTAYQTETSEDAIVAKENAFDAAIAKCNSDDLRAQGGAYKVVGRARNARDPDVNRDAEERAFEVVQAAITSRMAQFRPPGTE